MPPDTLLGHVLAVLGRNNVDTHRNVREDNGLPVKLQDGSAREPFVSMFGELVVGQRFVDLQSSFAFNISPTDLRATLIGTGTNSHANSKAQVTTGTGVGKSVLESHLTLSYRAGHDIYAFGSCVFDTPEANTIQKWGLVNTDDGFFVGYNDDVLGLGRISSTTESFVPRDAWEDPLDGTGASKFTLDPKMLNIFGLQFAYLGVSPVYFYVYGGAKFGWILFHTLNFVGKLTQPHIGNPYLPMSLSIERTSGTGADMTMGMASWVAGTIGTDRSGIGHRHFSNFNTKLAIGANVLTNIITIRNKTTYAGKNNHVIAEIKSIGVACDGTKNTRFFIYEDAALSGTPAFVDQDTISSIMEVDIAGIIVSGGTFILGKELIKNGQGEFPIDDDFFIHAEDSYTIAALSTGATDATVFLHWEERF